MEVQVAGDKAAQKLFRHLLILDSRPQSVNILHFRAHIFLLSQSQEFRDSENECSCGSRTPKWSVQGRDTLNIL